MFGTRMRRLRGAWFIVRLHTSGKAGEEGVLGKCERLALANAVDIRYRNIVRHLIERLNGKADVVSWDLRAASLKVVIL